MAVNNILTMHYMRLAHAAIATGYSSTIAFYELQKQNFLKVLSAEGEIGAEEFMKQVNREVEAAIENELSDTFEQAYGAVAEGVEDFIKNKVMLGQSVGYEDLVKRFQDVMRKGAEGKVNPKNLYDNLKNDIEKFLMSNGVDKSSIMAQVVQKSSLGKTNNADITNNLYGYARKVMLNQLMMGPSLRPSIKNYKNSIKGYYKEELLVPVFNKVLEKYGIKAVQLGSISNLENKQIQQDLGLIKIAQSGDNLNEILSRLESIASQSASRSVTMEEMIGGIQSKSWVEPWNRKSGEKHPWMSFGSHANLMPVGEAAFYWHAGVYNVMSNLQDVIGSNNFIYSTGSQVSFTSDLLTNFQQNQFVLGFYKRKDDRIVSADVGAQEHND